MVEIFLLIGLLQVKHFLADFVLQTEYMMAKRYRFGHPGALMHVLVHIVGTGIAFMILQAWPMSLVISVLVAEFIIHYLIDWTKDNLNRSRGLTAQDSGFWVLLGADQYLHHLTYLGIAYYCAGLI